MYVYVVVGGYKYFSEIDLNSQNSWLKNPRILRKGRIRTNIKIKRESHLIDPPTGFLCFQLTTVVKSNNHTLKF